MNEFFRKEGLKPEKIGPEGGDQDENQVQAWKQDPPADFRG